MSYPTKIATCCYCGTRAALVLRGKERHELSCGSCGAPLHDLKRVPKEAMDARDPSIGAVSHLKRAKYEKPKTGSYKPERKKKRKPRKGWMREILEEAVDLIEDVFD